MKTPTCRLRKERGHQPADDHPTTQKSSRWRPRPRPSNSQRPQKAEAGDGPSSLPRRNRSQRTRPSPGCCAANSLPMCRRSSWAYCSGRGRGCGRLWGWVGLLPESCSISAATKRASFLLGRAQERVRRRSQEKRNSKKWARGDDI